MNKTNEDDFAFWKELSNLVANHTFSYIDNDEYDEIISNILNDIYKLLLREDIVGDFNSYLQNNYSKEHTLIFEIIENTLSDKKFNLALSLNIAVNKKIIEDALNLLSVQLTVYDYDYPSKNDYSKLIIKLLPMNNQDDYSIKNNELSILKQEQIINNINKYKKHVDEKFTIHMVHNNSYNEIITRGLNIWRDSKNLHLYYRIKPFEDKHKTDKSKLADYLYSILHKHIYLYDSTDNIIHPHADYLIISLLPMVKTDIFYPFRDLEFPHIANNMFYRNTFQYTDLLRNRFILRPIQQIEEPQSVIKNFIRYLSNSDNQFNYIMNWLASFFQTLDRSTIALVLIGDVEATDVLISKVIKPIFALKKEYFCTIDNDSLKKIDESTIRDKVFYHIGEVSTANAKDKKTSKLVREILKFNRFTPEYAVENDETYIFGQLVVTSSKNNVYPFLKDSYSHCTVLKVNSLDTIVKNLNIDPLTVDNKIQDDLNNFASILAKYPADYLLAKKVLETEDKYPPVKTIDDNTLVNNIQDFIDAIKAKNISYFEPIKVINSALYDELIHNFNEGMIARQELFSYFDMLYSGSGITNNKGFLNMLKHKDFFFGQNIDKSIQYNKKKRYTISSVILSSNT